jgi:hypothetical protein
MVDQWQNLVSRRTPCAVVYFDQAESRDYPGKNAGERTIKWYPPIVTGADQISRSIDHVFAEKIFSGSITECQREFAVKCLSGFVHRAILLASGRADIIEIIEF